MALSAICGVASFLTVIYHGPEQVLLFEWIAVGSFESEWTLRVDALTGVMFFVVSFVSFLIHVYSLGYMEGAHDPHIPRFMCYLSMFTFFMLMLVSSDSLVQLFFGWEGVGLASYLLIGFWYTRPAANAAAIKAFIVNRVADFAFMLGIAATFMVFDSVQFDTIFADAAQHQDDEIVVFGTTFEALDVVAFLLFIGAMGKSAQLGLHTWLPDAMEGPTPVSALIHAATMVTAGVFLVARMSPVFEYAPDVLGLRRLHRRQHGVLRRHDRRRADRHQAGGRLLDLLAARLHVRRLRRLGLSRRHLPPRHPRLLQVAAVPVRGLGDHRAARGAGHAQHGRPVAQAADHLCGDVHRLAGARRHPVLRRLLLQGLHPRGDLGIAGVLRALGLLGRHARRRADRALHLPPDVHDLPRHVPADRTRPSRRSTRARGS